MVFAPRDAVSWLHLPRAGAFDGEEMEILSATISWENPTRWSRGVHDRMPVMLMPDDCDL